MDPFDVLGVDARYALDLDLVERRHRELSRTLHPDRFAGAPAAERRLALGRAIEVNEAWRALKDPVKRAEALLARAGVAHGETNEPKPPPSLLMEFMESREELAEARRAKDLTRVEKLAGAMRARKAAVEEAIAQRFDEAAGDRDRLATSVLPLLGELRYVRRFLDEARAIEEELGDVA